MTTDRSILHHAAIHGAYNKSFAKYIEGNDLSYKVAFEYVKKRPIANFQDLSRVIGDNSEAKYAWRPMPLIDGRSRCSNLTLRLLPTVGYKV